MERVAFILLILWLSSCNNSDNRAENKERTFDTILSVSDATSPAVTQSPLKKLSVVVLPPYDEIANAGISPNVQGYLEREISKDTSLLLIKFPYKQLIDVPYHNVFDKRYCKPITDKVSADILVMTRLDQKEKTGDMISDKWELSIRIYYVKTGNQVNSKIVPSNLTDAELNKFIELKQRKLVEEIKSNH